MKIVILKEIETNTILSKARNGYEGIESSNSHVYAPQINNFRRLLLFAIVHIHSLQNYI